MFWTQECLSEQSLRRDIESLSKARRELLTALKAQDCVSVQIKGQMCLHLTKLVREREQACLPTANYERA